MTKASVRQQAAQNMDALFGARQGERLVSNGFKMLAHERIVVRPQVRRTFDPSDMNELRASIRELRAQSSGIEGTGVLQALLVAPQGEGYRLIAGEKRFRATREEGLPQVPCVIVPAVSEGMTRLLQLTENTLRTAPPVLEEARALRETADEQGLSVRDLARVLGKTAGYVSNRLALLKMAPDVQTMVERRSDTLKHAPLIQAVQDEKLHAELIHAVVEDELSVKALERRLEPTTHLISQPTSTPSPAHHEPEVGEPVASVAEEDDAGAQAQRIDQTIDEAPPAPVQASRVSTVPDPARRDLAPPAPVPTDPVADLLKPAAQMAKEASRLLADRSLAPAAQKQVRAHIHSLEGTLASLKQLLG